MARNREKWRNIIRENRQTRASTESGRKNVDGHDDLRMTRIIVKGNLKGQKCLRFHATNMPSNIN